MEKLTDITPLKQVSLPGVENVNCTGLVLVVGPNSSGKTHLLRDIQARMSGATRSRVVAQDIDLDVPLYTVLLEVLEREHLIKSSVRGDGHEMILPLISCLGTGKPSPEVEARHVKTWSNQYSADQGLPRSEYLEFAARFLLTALFLEERLKLVTEGPAIDYATQPPPSDIHALHKDDNAIVALAKETGETFGMAVWPDATRGSVVCLRVRDSATLPGDKDLRSFEKMAEYRTIKDEGDGFKSYVGTCIALLLGSRPVCLIDEPEMCLHPPQAYSLGRFIGEFGTSSDRATFVATHSSHVLRGVIQTTQDLQIVRLTRQENSFQAHLVPPDVLLECLKKPTARAETVLDGVFAQAVVIVEAEGDRAVYQAVWNTMAADFPFDIHFTAVGGTGGIADTCTLYRKLKIPVAVIADLDIIVDVSILARVLAVMTDDAVNPKLTKSIDDVAVKIKEMPPMFTAKQAASAVGQIKLDNLNWANGDDETLRNELGCVRRNLDRMRKLKRGGVKNLPPKVRAPVVQVLAELQKHGAFLVPVGELCVFR